MLSYRHGPGDNKLDSIEPPPNEAHLIFFRQNYTNLVTKCPLCHSKYHKWVLCVYTHMALCYNWESLPLGIDIRTLVV